MNDCLDVMYDRRRIVKFDRSMLLDHLRGNIERKKIMESDVAGTIEESGSGVVQRAYSPEAESEDQCVGADAARSEESREGLDTR